MNFGENLRYIMECRDLSTKELSQKTGIKIDTINSYLKTKGSLPTLEKGMKIAKALNVQVEAFFNLENEPKTDSGKITPENQTLIKPEVVEITEMLNTMSNSELHIIKALIQLITKK